MTEKYPALTRQHRISIDYYKSPLSLKEIAKKYGLNNDGAIYSAVNRMDPNVVKIPEEDKVVIVVDKEVAHTAQMLLTMNDIKNYIPNKFELTEIYESEM